MGKSKTYTLYLMKEDVKSFEDAFTETAKTRIHAGNVRMEHTNEFGQKGAIYIFENPPASPLWLRDARTVFAALPAIQNKSSSAVLLFQVSDRIFATTFAHGWQFLDEAKIESDYGLRVAVNSLNDEKIKRVDRNHLGEAMKGVSQSAFQRDFQAFNIDEALDLVRKITGKTEEDGFADSIAGSTSLKITREMELSDIPEIAAETLIRFASDDYKKSGFHIIDKVRPILDPVILFELDVEAVECIKSGRDNFELSMPGWSEDEIVYYGFYGPGLRGRFPDLLLKEYRDAVGDNIDKLDVETIANKHGIVAEFNNDYQTKKRWSIKKALIGSIVLRGGLYAISEGGWYRLDEQFKNDIEESFEGYKAGWPTPPLKIVKKVSEDGSKTGYESELAYNRRCAEAYGQVCLDQEILTAPSIPFGKFEACDLLDIENKRLIHVKKSSRQSSVLSHFFKQGANSARILKLYPQARDELVNKVEALTDKETSDQLREALGDSMSGWTVEFHVIDAPRADGSFMIPFFSRITLREEARALNGMTFDVLIKFVPN